MRLNSIKTLQMSLKSIFFYILTLFMITSCTKDKSGCTNEFAENFDKNADSLCCCEYDVERIINEIVGNHNFEDICKEFDYDYSTTIRRNENVEGQIILENFSIYNQTYIGEFSNGEFVLTKEFAVGGCNFEFDATINKINGALVIDSYNKVIGGLCNNISDLECVATSK